MIKYKIEFSKDAKNDLTNIVNYISNNLKEPSIAKKLYHKIRANIYNLADNPKRFAIIQDNIILNLKLRKLIVDNYIIFYKINDNDTNVQIVRILYGKSNWKNLL